MLALLLSTQTELAYGAARAAVAAHSANATRLNNIVMRILLDKTPNWVCLPGSTKKAKTCQSIQPGGSRWDMMLMM